MNSSFLSLPYKNKLGHNISDPEERGVILPLLKCGPGEPHLRNVRSPRKPSFQEISLSRTSQCLIIYLM